MPVFKAYDVRGKYPSEIDETFARRIGASVAGFLGGRRIAVGRDVRKSAPAVARAVREGIVAAGAAAVDLGLVTTPMLYFAVGRYNLDGGIMVTASHNPPGDIGFKICREQAFPVGERTGLREIEARMKDPPRNGAGRIESASPAADYRAHIRSFLQHPPKLSVVVDAASGAVAAHFDAVFGDVPGIRWRRLCFTPDGSFPNHEPNPLKDANVRDLQAAMRETGADLGVAFDGDGDRCIFFERGGGRIRSDLITILLAKGELRRCPSSPVVYDLRSSRVVHEEILKAGGFPFRERVGHAFIKETMKRTGAVVGGELSDHYYFRDHYNADSGMMALAKVLDYLGTEGRPLEELLAPYRRTKVSGEINFRVKDKDAAMREIRRAFSGGRIDELDGVTVRFDDWWFNVRPSNTEPLVRLNVEADRPERLAAAMERLYAILGEPE